MQGREEGVFTVRSLCKNRIVYVYCKVLMQGREGVCLF